MSERKPIGVTAPYRAEKPSREQMERRVAELEAQVAQLKATVRALDRALLTGKK